jgi:hypothetical protein
VTDSSSAPRATIFSELVALAAIIVAAVHVHKIAALAVVVLLLVAKSTSREAEAAAASRPGVVFPRSGIFFWWQAGAVSALAARFDMSRLQFTGVSGGAIAATLAACGGCDAAQALDRALSMIPSDTLSRGPWALYGIWGDIVRRWLGELLPSDAAERCTSSAHLVLHRPFHLRQLVVSDFSSTADLIGACMASVHVPLFMDGAVAARYRGDACIDSDVLTLGLTSRWLGLPCAAAPSVRLDPFSDARVLEEYPHVSDLLRLKSPEKLRQLITWGAEFVEHLERAGELRALHDAAARAPTDATVRAKRPHTSPDNVLAV